MYNTGEYHGSLMNVAPYCFCASAPAIARLLQGCASSRWRFSSHRKSRQAVSVESVSIYSHSAVHPTMLFESHAVPFAVVESVSPVVVRGDDNDNDTVAQPIFTAHVVSAGYYVIAIPL